MGLFGWSLSPDSVPTALLGGHGVAGVEQVAVLVLGVARQVAVGRVDHLHASAHTTREGEDAHAGCFASAPLT